MKKNRRNRKSLRSGFTLLEVMVVLIIIVTIASLSVVAVQGQLARARVRTAIVYIQLLEDAVDKYALDMGQPPTTEQGLAVLITCPADISNASDWGGPYLKGKATSKDPWGMEYHYVSPGTRSNQDFEIWSYGPDRSDGTEDDITSWKSNTN